MSKSIDISNSSIFKFLAMVFDLEIIRIRKARIKKKSFGERY